MLVDELLLRAVAAEHARLGERMRSARAVQQAGRETPEGRRTARPWPVSPWHAALTAFARHAHRT